MKTNKLAKQIKKELTRNPKKTIALGLVTVVALWFWAPLVWKYVGGKPKKGKPAENVAATTPQTAPTVAATETAKGPTPTPKIDWDQLVKRIAGDERMISAKLPRDARDPFATTEQEEQLVIAQPTAPDAIGGAVKTAPMGEPTPEALGLVLQGTFVSQRTQRATISGKTYRPGAMVSVAATSSQSNEAVTNEKTPQKVIAFQVDLIESRSVVLSRHGKQYTLAIKRPSLNEDDEQLTLAPTSAEQPEQP